MAAPFDWTRRIARLPGPPYHLMTRVTRLDAEIATMKAGGTVEIEYDVPPDAWYFSDNDSPVMPFCVLLEIALQPCGWLSVFSGGPVSSEEDLRFRNLDGTGTVLAEVFPDAGAILTRTTMTSLSQASGMILTTFDVVCSINDVDVYTMNTTFGFFPPEALANQVGLSATDAERAWLTEPHPYLVDLTTRPERYCSGTLRLAETYLLMIDRVTGYWPDGGPSGLGRLRAEKDVNASEWFFKAHFYQDPVQPGSLGVEAMFQALKFLMLERGLGADLEDARFEAIEVGRPITWKYRGQVVPKNRRIYVELNLLEIGEGERGPYAVAEAWLWVDNLRIYHATNIGMQVVSGVREVDRSPEEVREPTPDAPLALDAKVVPFAPAMLRTYLRGLLDHGPWMGESVLTALCRQFIRDIVIEDPEDFESWRHRPVLFLGNHQIQVESLLFSLVASALTGVRLVTIAKAEHQRLWLGRLDQFSRSHPDINYPHSMVYFNQQDRGSMFDILAGLRREVEQGRSGFLHVEGELGLTCRKPVQRMSSVFVDFALDLGLPIVPVRFVGGLPVEPSPHKIDFPLGYGAQDYVIGRSIPASELRALTYAQRRQRVLAALNETGPACSEELPHPPNLALAERISAWMARNGGLEAQAAMLACLEMSEDMLPEIQQVRGNTPLDESTPAGRWVGDIHRWLMGQAAG